MINTIVDYIDNQPLFLKITYTVVILIMSFLTVIIIDKIDLIILIKTCIAISVITLTVNFVIFTFRFFNVFVDFHKRVIEYLHPGLNYKDDD